jgi:putative transposase
MGRPLRIQDDKQTVYFVTNRCLEARFFFRPSEKVNDLILSWLGRAASVYKVKILFFIFMSNHFHMGVLAEAQNLDGFMEYFEGNLARALNRKEFLDRDGPVFGRRYSAEPILDDAELMSKLEYTLNNPVRAGLVERIEDWPGVSSYSAHISGEPMEVLWASRTELSKMRRRVGHKVEDEQAAYKRYKIELMRLPQFAGKSPEEYATFIANLLERGAIAAARERQRKKVIGREGVLRQKPHRRPNKPKFSKRPPCHTVCMERRAEYLEKVRTVTTQYRQAMRRWQSSDPEMRFPPGTIPPGWQRCVQERDLRRDSYEDFY